MSYKKELVSIIIPTYNNEKYVSEAVDSAINQTYSNVEVIVVDDGSQDQTEEVLEKYKDKIVYIRQKNGGASSARNTGVTQSKGEWISFLDSDDIWEPRKLEQQISDLRLFPKAQIHSTNLKLERSSLTTVDFFSSKGFTNAEQLWALDTPLVEVIKYRFPWFQTTIIHRDLVEKLGPHDTKYPLYHDYEYMLRLAKSGSQWCVNSKPLVQVLRRDCNSNLSDLSTKKKAEMLTDWVNIHRHAIEQPYDFTTTEKETIQLALKHAYSAAVRHFSEVGDNKEAKRLCKEARDHGVPSINLKRMVWMLTQSFKRKVSS